ncbi:MAG: MFS transporter [Spirochaetes bacterium]|nr:MFS transporter [Spirochaetota bacterium]
MVSITAVVALLTTILMGTLSDGVRGGRWGRRRPFMLIGYLFWGIFTAVYPLAALFRSVTIGVGMAILFDSVMSFWGSTANDAAFNAWITDITTDGNRGAVVGVTEILKWIALLVTYAGAGFLVAALGYTGFFVAIGALVTVIGVIGAFVAREPPAVEPPREGYWKRIAGTFQWRSLKENRTLLAILVSVAVWNTAFNVFFPYLMIYLQHYVRLPVAQSSMLIAIAIFVGGIAAGYPLGILADRWGRRPVAFAAIALEAAGLLLFSFTKSFVALLASGILWVMPMAAWSIATTAWEKDLFPEEKRGQFQGWEILFRVTIAMTLGPLLGGWLATRYGIPTVLDGKPGFIPTPILFQVAAAGTLLAAIPLLATREKKREAAAAS